jgi:hypothetical protein
MNRLVALVMVLTLAAICGEIVQGENDPHRPERSPAGNRCGYSRGTIAPRTRGLSRSHVQLCADERGADPAIERVIEKQRDTGDRGVAEWIGVAIALVSSCLGGTAAAITRYLVGNADPITLAILRWGIGFACLLPTALLLGVRWPSRSDWPAVAALGLCFFGLKKPQAPK